jgi:hypothetical protein
MQRDDPERWVTRTGVQAASGVEAGQVPGLTALLKAGHQPQGWLNAADGWRSAFECREVRKLVALLTSPFVGDTRRYADIPVTLHRLPFYLRVLGASLTDRTRYVLIESSS